MKSSSKARVGRPARGPAAVRPPSVSAEAHVLRLIDPAAFDRARVKTAICLRDAGASLAAAHRAITDLAERGEAVLTLPGRDVPAARLRAAGIGLSTPEAPQVDVKAVRARSGLSQSEFAARYGLNLRTLQGLERRGHLKDPAARAFFWLIANDPDAVDKALGVTRA